jgi:hypothetical protein
MAKAVQYPFEKQRKETPESGFRKMAIDWLKIRYRSQIWHYRTVAGIGFRKGIPDDCFIVRGVPVWIEFKRPDGKWSKSGKRYTNQLKEIEAIRAAGGRADFVDSMDSLKAILAGIEPVQKMIGE